MRRGAPGSGVAVDPQRIRQARLEAGLSLRAVAGEEISPTFIHFVERGISRPSRPVLALIARRTGKPIGYFTTQHSDVQPASQDLAGELARAAEHARHFGATRKLSTVEHEAMKLIEVALRQASEVARSIERSGARAARRS